MGEVYKAIAAVQGDIAKEGIGKGRKNAQQNYNFRGIDDVFNALAPLLSKHGLCILPRVTHREQVERISAKGGALFYTTVDVEFDFVSASDGSCHVVRVSGEAMDSADKSTNKAMSAAYKYAAMQAFCIPTEGDNDADATTHEVEPRKQPAPLLGKHKTRAKLKEAIHAVVEEMKSCEDEDQLDAYLATPDAKDTIDQTREEHAFWWDGDGGDFKGLNGEIVAAYARVKKDG